MDRSANVVKLIGSINSTQLASTDSYLIQSNQWYYGRIWIASGSGTNLVSNMQLWDNTGTLLNSQASATTVSITNGLPLVAGRETGHGWREAETTSGVFPEGDLSFLSFYMPIVR
jgi:hypothetical protein